MTTRNFWVAFICVALAGAMVFWWLSAHLTKPRLEGIGDAKNGAYIARAAGCASCHGEDYGGGEEIHTPFGKFYAPNITPAKIGNWGVDDLANALINGQSPTGDHYYPSFPYTSYQNMKEQDIVDLHQYLMELAPVQYAPPSHDLVWFARWRRPLGLWKKMAGSPDIIATDAANDSTQRGAYLANGLAHCAECHSPRNLFGMLKNDQLYEGGIVYGVNDTTASITPNLVKGDSANWTRNELVEYLTTGFTPDYDSAGGDMVDVIENTSKLSTKDREAIADYLISIRNEE